MPVYWACPIVNGDCSGITAEENAEIDGFMSRHKLGGCAVDVAEESYFAMRNDANNMGGDVCEYTFVRISE